MSSTTPSRKRKRGLLLSQNDAHLSPLKSAISVVEAVEYGLHAEEEAKSSRRSGRMGDEGRSARASVGSVKENIAPETRHERWGKDVRDQTTTPGSSPAKSTTIASRTHKASAKAAHGRASTGSSADVPSSPDTLTRAGRSRPGKAHVGKSPSSNVNIRWSMSRKVNEEEEADSGQDDDDLATNHEGGSNRSKRVSVPTQKAVELLSARKRGRPRKSATVQETRPRVVTSSASRTNVSRRGELRQAPKGSTSIDLGFKDIPKGKTTGTKSVPVREISNTPDKAEALSENEAASADELGESDTGPARSLTVQAKATPSAKHDIDEESEIACGICRGIRSKPPNEILLCDGCDFAAHQKCYDVPVIPDGDWFCQKCLPEDPMDVDMVEELEEATANEIPAIENLATHLATAQRLVLDRITGATPASLQGHDEERAKVHQLIEQTIVAGEGNSMLLIGARGSGKTLLVETILKEMSKMRQDCFHTVRLNGFIHTDDRIASREIWRQLGREMELEDELGGKMPSYADTLTSLLALLSHPSEMSTESAGNTAKSVIFILDEFDLFATHPRQTLLYNLFDIAQARKAPIAVLGLTTRIDVVEALEKRVKSRFSHRYVHLSLPKSLPAYWEVCKSFLMLESGDLHGKSRLCGEKEFTPFWNDMIEKLYASPKFKTHISAQYHMHKSIPTILTTFILPITHLSVDATNPHFPLTAHSFPETRRATKPTEQPSLALSPTPQLTLLAPDNKMSLLPSLSIVSLALLICAARLEIIHDTEAINFAMAYEEYLALASKAKLQASTTTLSRRVGHTTAKATATSMGTSTTRSLAGMRVWSKAVALGSWETLCDLELLVPALAVAGMSHSTGGGGGGGGTLAGRMMRVDVALEELAASGVVDGDAGEGMGRWVKEI